MILLILCNGSKSHYKNAFLYVFSNCSFILPLLTTNQIINQNL